jgi:hypothetical protein
MMEKQPPFHKLVHKDYVPMDFFVVSLSAHKAFTSFLFQFSCFLPTISLMILMRLLLEDSASPLP